MGHINGEVTIWKISETDTLSRQEPNLTFLGRFSTSLKRICAMHYYETSTYGMVNVWLSCNSIYSFNTVLLGGALCCGDVSGKVVSFRALNLNEDVAAFEDEHVIIEEEDGIKPEKIFAMKYREKTFLIISRKANLLILGMNENGVIFDERGYYIEEHYITGKTIFYLHVLEI